MPLRRSTGTALRLSVGSTAGILTSTGTPPLANVELMDAQHCDTPSFSPWTADLTTTIRRRPGDSPSALKISNSGATCPDVLETETGDLIVIGTDVTDLFTSRLPAGAGRAPHERIVMIPASTLLSAAEGLSQGPEEAVDQAFGASSQAEREQG